MAGTPIDIGDIRPGYLVRVVTPFGIERTGFVKSVNHYKDRNMIVKLETGERLHNSFGGVPGEKDGPGRPRMNKFFHVGKDARGLAEIVTASQHPSMQNVPRGKELPVGPEHLIASFLGVRRAPRNAAQQRQIEEAAQAVRESTEAREKEEALAAMKAGRRKTRRRKTRKSRK